MSCPNFCYQRRCVLVTNDDFDFGNYPSCEEQFDGDRTYPSSYLDKYRNEFSTVAIVLTAGYYSDACIDIVNDDTLVPELSCSDYYFARLTRDELFNDLYYYFNGNISKRMMLRHLKGLNRRDDNYQADLACAIDRIFEEVRDREVAKANKILDAIKQEYGYTELACGGIFSNGEAIYHEIR